MFLRTAWTGGQLSENAVKVAATMDLEWMPVGVVRKGLPFIVEEFLAEMRKETAEF